MSEQRKFKCTLEALLTVADAVCGAAERHGELGSRLPKDIVATTRGLAASVRKRKMAQDVAFTGIESLTQEQNAKLKVVEELLGQVRESAKKAFRGDQVKLRKQFYIGGERRYDLGSTIEEARSIQANCALDENQTARHKVGCRAILSAWAPRSVTWTQPTTFRSRPRWRRSIPRANWYVLRINCTTAYSPSRMRPTSNGQPATRQMPEPAATFAWDHSPVTRPVPPKRRWTRRPSQRRMRCSRCSRPRRRRLQAPKIRLLVARASLLAAVAVPEGRGHVRRAPHSTM